MVSVVYLSWLLMRLEGGLRSLQDVTEDFAHRHQHRAAAQNSIAGSSLAHGAAAGRQLGEGEEMAALFGERRVLDEGRGRRGRASRGDELGRDLGGLPGGHVERDRVGGARGREPFGFGLALAVAALA